MKIKKKIFFRNINKIKNFKIKFSKNIQIFKKFAVKFFQTPHCTDIYSDRSKLHGKVGQTAAWFLTEKLEINDS